MYWDVALERDGAGKGNWDTYTGIRKAALRKEFKLYHLTPLATHLMWVASENGQNLRSIAPFQKLKESVAPS